MLQHNVTYNVTALFNLTDCSHQIAKVSVCSQDSAHYSTIPLPNGQLCWMDVNFTTNGWGLRMYKGAGHLTIGCQLS